MAFDLTKELPSLELCRRLKELGLPQGSAGWYWQKYEDGRWDLGYHSLKYRVKELSSKKLIIRAPTIPEMWSWLPDMIDKRQLFIEKYRGRTTCGYWYRREFEDVTIAECLAKLLIWSAENGYVKFRGRAE